MEVPELCARVDGIRDSFATESTEMRSLFAERLGALNDGWLRCCVSSMRAVKLEMQDVPGGTIREKSTTVDPRMERQSYAPVSYAPRACPQEFNRDPIVRSLAVVALVLNLRIGLTTAGKATLSQR